MSNKCFNGAYLKWWAGIDIRDMLLENSAITQFTGDNIYPIIAPENTKGSFIVYRRIKYSREYSKMGMTEDTARIEIMAIAEDYEDSVSLAALIDTALTGSHTNDQGYSLTLTLNDSEEGFDDMKYIQTLIFEVK